MPATIHPTGPAHFEQAPARIDRLGEPRLEKEESTQTAARPGARHKLATLPYTHMLLCAHTSILYFSVLHNISHYLLSISMSPYGAADGLIPSRAGRVRVPGFFVFPEVVLPPPVFLLIYPCAAGCDRTRLSFHFTKGPGQIAPRCYLDDAERVHAVLCRERGQGSRV